MYIYIYMYIYKYSHLYWYPLIIYPYIPTHICVDLSNGSVSREEDLRGHRVLILSLSSSLLSSSLSSSLSHMCRPLQRICPERRIFECPGSVLGDLSLRDLLVHSANPPVRYIYVYVYFIYINLYEDILVSIRINVYIHITMYMYKYMYIHPYWAIYPWESCSFTQLTLQSGIYIYIYKHVHEYSIYMYEMFTYIYLYM
jgi:hypothetical protein